MWFDKCIYIAGLWFDNCIYIAGKHDHSYGYWAAGQPEGSDTSCTYVDIDTKQYYKYAWSLNSCQEALPYVCRAPACLLGESRTKWSCEVLVSSLSACFCRSLSSEYMYCVSHSMRSLYVSYLNLTNAMLYSALCICILQAWCD